MGGILDFNTKNLEILLTAKGLKKTWIDILATHLDGKPQFSYILENKFFKSAKKGKTDLLSNLSLGSQMGSSSRLTM